MRLRLYIRFKGWLAFGVSLRLACKLGLVILLVLDFCDNSMREKDWRYRKCGTQATRGRQGDLAGVTRARQRQSFERMHAL